MYSFFQSCTNYLVLICTFLKSCTTITKMYNQRKKLYIFGTLSLAFNFNDNGVCTKTYSFFQTCTNSVVLICIFLKSCTTIKKLYNQRKKLYNQRKKLYNQRKKLYIFGTLSLAFNFIDNGVCSKMYSLFQSFTNFLVLICIFLKSCRTIEKLYIFSTLSLSLNFIHNCVCTKTYSFFRSSTNSVVLIYIYNFKKLYNYHNTVQRNKKSLVHCSWLLVSLKTVFLPFFFQSCANSVVLICIFLKCCTMIKKLHNQRKKLYIFGTLSLALNFIHNGACTKMYTILQSCTHSAVLICIFLKTCTTIKKLYNQRKKLYIFGTLYLALNCINNGVCTKMYSFFQTCTNSVVLICILLKSCKTIKMLYNQREKLYIFVTLSLAHNFIDNGVCGKMYSFFPKL